MEESTQCCSLTWPAASDCHKRTCGRLPGHRFGVRLACWDAGIFRHCCAAAWPHARRKITVNTLFSHSHISGGACSTGSLKREAMHTT